MTMKALGTTTLLASIPAGAIEAISMFMSRDSQRMSINQLSLEASKDCLRLSATDGHSLATLAIRKLVEFSGPPVMTGVSARHVQQMILTAKQHSSGPTEIVFGPDTIRFHELTLPRSRERFAPFRQVLPSERKPPAQPFIHLAPKYIERIGKAFLRAGAENVTLDFQMGDALNPVVWTGGIDGDPKAMVCIVMPRNDAWTPVVPRDLVEPEPVTPESDAAKRCA